MNSAAIPTAVSRAPARPRAPLVSSPELGFLIGLFFGVPGMFFCLWRGSRAARRSSIWGFALKVVLSLSLVALALTLAVMAPDQRRVSEPGCACSFELSSSLSRTDGLNSKADLQYVDSTRRVYLVDLVEARADIFYDSPAAYAEDLKLEDDAPFEQTTIGGFPAVKRTFTQHGTKNGDVNAHLVEAVIATPEHFHHVLAGTLASRRERYGAELDAMVSSFRAVE